QVPVCLRQERHALRRRGEAADTARGAGVVVEGVRIKRLSDIRTWPPAGRHRPPANGGDESSPQTNTLPPCGRRLATSHKRLATAAPPPIHSFDSTQAQFLS